MSKHQVFRLLFMVPLFALASCVSVNIGGAKPSSAQGVNFTEPRHPFQLIDLQDADKAWQNKDNGTTISYLSTCNDPADPTLQAARGESLSSLTDLKVLKESEMEFNDREALTTIAEGTVDGVKTRLELLLFKKNKCLYSISYVALSNKFNESYSQYRDFVQSFRAP